MSVKTFTFTECVIIIAYLGFMQSVDSEQTNQSPAKKEARGFGPARSEKGSDSIKRPDYTIEDLLEQIPADHSYGKKANDEPFGPHRAEKGSNSIKRPDYTLKDLLDQVKENSSHDEIDTGRPVGNEVW